MTPEDIARIVALLDALGGEDTERAHADADDIILSALPQEIRDAFNRASARAGGFWYA